MIFYHEAEINRHLTSHIHRFIINQKPEGPNTALTKAEFELILAVIFYAASFRGSGLFY